MLQLIMPWTMLLLPLPILLHRWMQPYPSQEETLRVPFLYRLSRASGQSPQNHLAAKRLPLQRALIIVLWLSVILALTRPVWLGEPVIQQLPSRDLMLAVDISASMETDDMRDSNGTSISRLEALKTILSTMAEQRQGDRFGLILFGTAPYLQVPFTSDSALFSELLDEAKVPMAGPKTMLGDAIGLALKHFESSHSQNKLLLLITDGKDSGSRIPPLEAARFAADSGIKIHTVAIGSQTTTGESELDMELLEAVSRQGGGKLFSAEGHTELENLSQWLDQLEPSELKKEAYQPRTELYQWPLAFGFLFALFVHTRLAWHQWNVSRV